VPGLTVRFLGLTPLDVIVITAGAGAAAMVADT
jgi:hypothetical protein